MVLSIRYRWQNLGLLLLAAAILLKNSSLNLVFFEQYAISSSTGSTSIRAASTNNPSFDNGVASTNDKPQKETKRVPLSSGHGSHGSNTSSSSSRPPLSALVQRENESIVGDVQFLLDFGLVGHGKTGTTTQMHWIREHERVQMRGEEVHYLKQKQGGLVKMVEYLYDLPEGDEYKRGYKAPSSIITPRALNALRTYWPKTKLVVGIRHPVKWMESHYNFKKHIGRNLPPAEQMVGDALPEKVQMHKHLALLGKTIVSANDKEQYELLGWHHTVSPPPKMVNPIFLYESGQPFDANRTRAELYAKDMSDFLGLSPPLQPIGRREGAGHSNPAIDICNELYVQLRRELMEVARNTSIWINKYFLDHQDVTVSSRDHFRNVILKSWMVDPCEKSPQEEEQ